MDCCRSDCILTEILEDNKSLTGFLDAIFGFLSRKTDFYHVQHTTDDKVGFPRGVKEQILLSCMQKYEHLLEQPKPISDFVVESPSYVAEEIEIITEETSDFCPKEQRCLEQSFVDNSNECSQNIPSFNVSDYKNGSVFESYCWSQTLNDVEINIILPVRVKLGKDIKVHFEPKCITVRTLFPKEEVLISGETWEKYRHNNVIWSISDGILIISFDKIKRCWWDKLFLNENAIDNKAVDTELSEDNSMLDIKNTIEKYANQNSYMNPANTHLNKDEQIARLRQAWNAENSPFRGQPFDPSVIQFN